MTLETVMRLLTLSLSAAVIGLIGMVFYGYSRTLIATLRSGGKHEGMLPYHVAGVAFGVLLFQAQGMIVILERLDTRQPLSASAVLIFLADIIIISSLVSVYIHENRRYGEVTDG